MRRMIHPQAVPCLNRYLPGTAQRLGSVGGTWTQRLEGEREGPTGAEVVRGYMHSVAIIQH